MAQHDVVGIALVDDLNRVPPDERKLRNLATLELIDDLPDATVTTPLADMLLKMIQTPRHSGERLLVDIVPPTRLRQLFEI